jgi:serine/threonine protein kinase
MEKNEEAWDILTRHAQDSLIGTRYQIKGLLGKGGCGRVDLAIDKRLGRLVAVKRLGRCQSKESFVRFQREAQALARISHPHIVKVLDWSCEAGEPYLVMEYLEGRSLADQLRKGPLPVSTALALARQIGGAIDALHDVGLLHRDIKPGNILWREPSDTYVLVDLGLSRDLDQETLTETGILLGTPGYLPPEVIAGSQWEDRSDLYQLGAVLFEAIEGVRLVPGENVDEVLQNSVEGISETWKKSSAPQKLRRAVDRATAHLPEDRFPDCETLVEALFVDSKKKVGEQRRLSKKVARPKRTPRFDLNLLFSVVCISIGIYLIYIYQFPELNLFSRTDKIPPPCPKSAASRLATQQSQEPFWKGIRSLSVCSDAPWIELDPLQWPVVLSHYPPVKDFMKWVEDGGDWSALSERRKAELRACDQKFNKIGLMRPFFPHAYLNRTRPLSLPSLSNLEDHQGSDIEEVTWIRQAQEIKSAVLDSFRKRKREYQEQGLPTSFDSGVLRLFGRTDRSLNVYLEEGLRLRGNRIALTQWLKEEFDLFASFLLYAGRALNTNLAQNDSLAVNFSEALDRLEGLRSLPSMVASPVYATGGPPTTPGGYLFLAKVQEMRRELLIELGMNGGRPTHSEENVLREAFATGGGQVGMMRRKRAASLLLRMSWRKGGKKALLASLPEIRFRLQAKGEAVERSVFGEALRRLKQSTRNKMNPQRRRELWKRWKAPYRPKRGPD